MFVFKLKINLNLKEFGLNIINVVFDDLIYGKIWLMLFKIVFMFYVLFVLDIIYFIDDVNVEWFIWVFSENKDIIIVGGSYKN